MENEIRLERFQESIHCYYRIELKECGYFEDVEYRMFCHNCWDAFLPILLRERDGRRWALYRTDGRISLAERSRQSDLTLAVCRELVRGVLRVMEISRENMLELSHVCFKPEYIFLDMSGGCSWCYLPYPSEHVKTDFEELAAWLLSKVNYDDSESVKFVYYLHWCIRKEELSEKMLKNCLLNCESGMTGDSRIDRTKEENAEEASLADIFNSAAAASTERREMYRQMETVATDREEGRNRNGSEKGKDIQALPIDDYGQAWKGNVHQAEVGSAFCQESKKRKAGRILLFAICLLCLLGAGVLLYIGNVYRFTRMNARVMMAFLLTASASGTASYLLSPRRAGRHDTEDFDESLEEGTGGTGRPRGRENESRDEYLGIREGNLEKEENLLNRAGRNDGMISGELLSYEKDEPEEDGTVVLGIHKADRMPALQDICSGEIRMIQDDPWYIGSDRGKSHLWIDTRTVSRRHARIYRSKESNEILIMDLNSTNGTKVNGITLLPEVARSLSDGDIIGISEKQYRFLSS